MDDHEYELGDEDLVDALLKALPELHAAYRQETGLYDGPIGAHVIFGDVLNPALLSALRHPELHADFLQRAFDLLETLLTRGGSRADNVVSVVVCERLIDDPALFAAALPFIHKETEMVARTMAQA